MSEQVHRFVGLPARTTGLRSLARAFCLSLGVHAVLIGALWCLIVTSLPPPREPRVEVELAPRSAPPIETAAVPPPVETTIASAAPAKSEKPRAERVVHAQARIAPRVVSDASDEPVSDAPARVDAEPLTQPGERVASRDAVAIDLRVLEWLARYRTYPLAARRARIEGVVQLRVTLMPDGRLVDAHIEQSSGHPLLDRAALDLLARAARLPAEFASERIDRIELQLPFVYRMRT